MTAVPLGNATTAIGFGATGILGIGACEIPGTRGLAGITGLCETEEETFDDIIFSTSSGIFTIKGLCEYIKHLLTKGT